MVPESWPVGDRDASGPLRIAYVGRLENQLKGLSRAVDVLREMEQTGVVYQFSFFGDGEYRAELTSRLHDLVSTGRVSFEGQVARDALLRRLPGYHVLLLFSHSEGLNMAMLEAMAAGVVPVVSETVGVREVIADGANGFVIPQDGLVKGMAAAVSRLCSSESLWCEISQCAWQTVHQSYSYNKMVGAYRELFLGVASMGAAARPEGRLACRKDRFDFDWVPNRCARMLRILASRLESR